MSSPFVCAKFSCGCQMISEGFCRKLSHGWKIHGMIEADKSPPTGERKARGRDGLTMSVTVADLLSLPSLRNARLAAGKGGLGKPVSSISVLEYAAPNLLQDELFQKNEFYGSEVVITGFMNIPEDVEAQCVNIRRLAAAGEVGLILFYVGIFMPRVDQALLMLADELDFPLIVMPEKQMNQRYSEVICEVMEAIFRDQNSAAGLVGDILQRISLLPEYQRTLDAVLRLLSDRIRTSAALADGARHVLSAANWPRTLELEPEKVLPVLPMLPESYGAPLELEGGRFLLYRCTLADTGTSGMELFLLREGAALPPETVRQAAEAVRLSVNLWGRGHDREVMGELVRAILRDEPLKMRRLADIFHVDVASIHSMWLLHGGVGRAERFQREALPLAKEVLSHACNTLVADYYEDVLVIFMDWAEQAPDLAAMAEALCTQLTVSGLEGILTVCQDLPTTADVRSAYLTIQTALADAVRIWPDRRCYTLSEMTFAHTCRETVERGEKAVQQTLAPLAILRSRREEAELVRTLQVYLLDGGCSVTKTAERLFLHKNTVKYRMQQIQSRLGHPANKLPEVFPLYTACATERLLRG